jgi:hypothetical protein
LNSDDQDEVQRIAAIIERHFEQSPAAADTVEGIWRCWLPSEKRTPCVTVERAMALLESEGRVERRPLPDGGFLYVLSGCRHGPRDR